MLAMRETAADRRRLLLFPVIALVAALTVLAVGCAAVSAAETGAPDTPAAQSSVDTPDTPVGQLREEPPSDDAAEEVTVDAGTQAQTPPAAEQPPERGSGSKSQIIIPLSGEQYSVSDYPNAEFETYTATESEVADVIASLTPDYIDRRK